MIEALSFLLLLLGVQPESAEFCRRIPTPPSTFEGETLVPGEYRIVFVATKGKKKGKSIEGTLVLHATSVNDVSPVTGEQALDHDISETPLYGWLEADLAKVDAPICTNPPHPDPTSTDPISPGVLVHLIDWKEPYPENTPVLTVAALVNLRNEHGWEDGCGIGLWVRQMDGKSFSGDWKAWGIVHAGSGHFCAYPTSKTE